MPTPPPQQLTEEQRAALHARQQELAEALSPKAQTIYWHLVNFYQAHNRGNPTSVIYTFRSELHGAAKDLPREEFLALREALTAKYRHTMGRVESGQHVTHEKTAPGDASKITHSLVHGIRRSGRY